MAHRHLLESRRLPRRRRAGRRPFVAVVGAYDGDGRQAGYLRVISDRATFAYVADVYVDAAHRGRGLARALVRFALAHPEHQGLRRWLLATADAHGVYREVGFQPLPSPERWMALLPPPPG